MHFPEALILRRCFPVPVTLDDLRAAYNITRPCWTDSYSSDGVDVLFHRTYRRESVSASIKEITGAIDEVYAVIDGREVRVATADGGTWCALTHIPVSGSIDDLLDKADRDGYWARPHEVRLDLQERPISRETVAQAVLVGQQYLERSGDGGAA